MLQVFKKLIIKTNPFEIVDITHDIYDQINTCDIKNGLVNLSILHTSCSLIIQENADPTVLKDISSFLERIVPEGDYYLHNTEGPDDMPAHLKSLITQTHISLSLKDKKIILGTWQGIYLLEHRASSRKREILVHILGEN
jgi:secondary thiamine-phosphate synthase enzyme